MGNACRYIRFQNFMSLALCAHRNIYLENSFSIQRLVGPGLSYFPAAIPSLVNAMYYILVSAGAGEMQ